MRRTGCAAVSRALSSTFLGWFIYAGNEIIEMGRDRLQFDDLNANRLQIPRMA